MGTQTPPHFGALLRHYRLRAGLTQEQLAECAGLSARAIGALERDASRCPRLATATLLAGALALSDAARAAFVAAARPDTAAAGAPPPADTPAGAPSLADTPASAPSPVPTPAGAPLSPYQEELLAPELLGMALTPLVGREHEEAAITHLLGRARLLTLTGPGGVGKTRLALHMATQARARYAAVHIISLAAIHDPALVLGSVARARPARRCGGHAAAAGDSRPAGAGDAARAG